MDCFGHPWLLLKNFAGKIEMLEAQECTLQLVKIESEREKTRLGLNMLRKHLPKKLQILLF
jgi:hypothetical protein